MILSTKRFIILSISLFFVFSTILLATNTRNRIETQRKKVQKKELTDKKIKSNKEKKKKSGPVNIKGDLLEYNYSSDSKNRENDKVIITGNAWVKQDTITIKADKIIMIGSTNRKAYCYDNVEIIDSESSNIIKGGYVEYFKSDEYARILKNPELYVKKDNVTMTAIEMERYFNENKFIAKGNVNIVQTNRKAVGEMAVYTETNRLMVLTGSPILYRNDDIYKADRIELWLDSNKLFLIGNVDAIVNESD